MCDLTRIPIDTVKGVGKVKKRILNNMGITSVEDLLYHFPRKYEDRTNLRKFYELISDSVETTKGHVVSTEVSRPKPRFNILKVVLFDGESYLTVNWFNQGEYLKNKIKLGMEIIVTGKIRRNFGKLEMSVYDYELIDGTENINSGRIIPFYPSAEGLNQRFIRGLIKYSLDNYLSNIPEILPNELVQSIKIPSIQWCILNMHFPVKIKEQEMARRYLAYREFAFYQLGILTRRKSITKIGCIMKDSVLIQNFLQSLPFKLTNAQERVWADIKNDLKKSKPMARLLQGDVGSGKTVIAALSLIVCCSNGYQGALMAPTEVLAKQHYLELYEPLEKLNIRVALLTGSLSQTEKNKVLEKISSGNIDLIIGTHSIIQENVQYYNLGLVVIDEQHRFGVNQRLKLQEKGKSPNVLVMTATPIPRTLALTLYGDLDVSIIDEKPLGRGMVITKYVSDQNRRKLYEFVKKQIELGRQIFVICPLIEESEKLDIENAVRTERVFKEIYADYSVRLVHSKVANHDKEEIMDRFREGTLSILISTTVVEVGINVPNANVMIIEGVERFGLSQLHQLRGRISRSKIESYCFLLGKLSGENAKSRTKIMCETNDGFKIAEMDLKLRGPGEMFGTRQHGVPEFKVANIVSDGKILEASTKHVKDFIDTNLELAQALSSKNTKFMNIDFTKIYG